MPDYQKSKIYKLWSPSKNLVYYGSTTQTISQRLAEHLKIFKTYNNANTKKYYTSFLVLDCEDYKIELLEEYACNNRQQLEKKEGEYIRNNECCNKNIAGRTTKEYYIDNADKLKEQFKEYNTINADKLKQYYIDNADKKKEYNKQYRIDNVDKIKEYNTINADKIKEYKKKYYIANADKKKEHQKEYYIANADKKKEYNKQYYLKKKAEK